MIKQEEKILVTGASGLLGANAVRALHEEGFHIRLLVRRTANLEALDNIHYEVRYGDICDADDVHKAMDGCSYVLHAASMTRQWGIKYDEYRRINILGTQNVVKACLSHGIKKLIYISTANTIGPGTKLKPGNELNSFSLLQLNSGYINSKYVAQQYVQEQIERNGLPAVILNPTFMIGPYDSKPSSGQIILYAIQKKIVFYPPGGKNFVHVRDVCKAIINAIRFGKPGDFYLIAGQNLTYREFFTLLNKVTQKKRILIPIPSILLKTAGFFGTATAQISKRSVKLGYASAKMLCIHNYYTGHKSERELNIQYTDTETAISDALQWFNRKSETIHETK